MLEASNNPSTIEQLSIELGIAAPYMEEEVRLLTEATLLKKIGDKYITSLFIADKECQLDMYKAMRQFSKERSAMVDKIADDMIPELRALGTVRNDMTDADIKWWLVIHIIDFCVGETG